MAYAYPILIKAKLSDVDDDVFMRLIRLMENLTFRSLIRGGRADITSRLQNVLPSASDNSSFNKMIDNIIWKLKNDWWWGYWSDTEMYNHLKSGWFYGNRVDNYLLWRYEQYLCCLLYTSCRVQQWFICIINPVSRCHRQREET